MNHPEREAWVPFLFGEAAPDARRKLAAHLQSCPQCAAEIEGWRRSLGKLDRWQLPPALSRRPEMFAPAARWALAASLVLFAGVAVGRLTASSGISREQLRAEVETAISTSVEQARSQSASSVSELEARLARNSEAQNRQLLRAFTEAFDQAREQDRASILAVLDQVEREHAADYVALRSDLETVASAADEQLREARRRIVQIAGNERRDGIE
jgi:hypothetical protein